ncbi:unnamed protein product [Chrysoparadoxa australica]
MRPLALLLPVSRFLSYGNAYSFISHCMPRSSFAGRNLAAATPFCVEGRGNDRTTMVFDYIKRRTEEGVKQVENISTLAGQGKLGEALQDTADYLKQRKKADSQSIAKFADGLAKSREKFLSDLGSLGTGGGPLDETLEKLEEVLMSADIGATTTLRIIDDLREIASGSGQSLGPADIKAVLRGTLVDVLSLSGTEDASSITFAPPEQKLSVLFVMGANGMGKTTTIGKLAARLRVQGEAKVLLAAADTFRAAAVEQLAEWADRAEVDIVKPIDNEKASTVVYKACEKALAEDYDVLIVDTSGRLSNNKGLNEELNKMKRVIGDQIPGGPHETLLVVDASVGRNAVDQATIWKQSVGLSGIVVTKLDGTAKGGFAVGITQDLDIPVKLIGVGETIEDLRDFDAELYVDSLLGISEAEAVTLKKSYETNEILRNRMQAKLEANKSSPQEERWEAMMSAAAQNTATRGKGSRRAQKRSKGKKK